MRSHVDRMKSIVSDKSTREEEDQRLKLIHRAVNNTKSSAGAGKGSDEVKKQHSMIKELATENSRWVKIMNYAILLTIFVIVLIIGKKILYYEKKHLI